MEKNGLAGSTALLVLSLLRDGDKYGYEMISQLALRSEGVFELKEGTLYPILRRLEAAKQLTVECATHNGRTRKYYHITKEGLARIAEFKAEWREILSIYQFVAKEDMPRD